MNLEFSKQIMLENKRAKLEPLDWKHFESLLQIALDNPDLLRYSPSKFGTSEDLKAYFDTAFKSKRRELHYHFAIFDKNKEISAWT